jgi:hypothetical protein
MDFGIVEIFKNLTAYIQDPDQSKITKNPCLKREYGICFLKTML